MLIDADSNRCHLQSRHSNISEEICGGHCGGGCASFVLIHQYAGDDHEIARKLSSGAGGIENMEALDPLRLKAIIGAGNITVGPRSMGW